MPEQFLSNLTKMKLRILLTLYAHNNGGRVRPLKPLLFHPEWRSASKPGANTAPITQPSDPIPYGSTIEAVIEPKVPLFWSAIKAGETLYCCDGKFIIGDALVMDIEKDQQDGENAFES